MIFQSARRIKSFFPTKILSTVPKCQKLYIRLVVGTARISTLEKRNEDCMTEKLNILKASQVPVMHLLSQTTSRQLVNLKWDHFEILANGRSDTHCKIKETLLIQELKPTLNDTVSSEKLFLY